ncbi:PTS transporter subunit EIIB, partial [Loigolactobacillus coryniformis]
MAKNYADLASSVLKSVGGAENVANVFHCATRLRFNLKDIDIAKQNIDSIKARKDVIDVIVQNGQFQVVIGPDVSKAFAELTKLVSPSNTNGENETANEPEKKKSKGDRFFEVVSGIFTPVVPVLMASGMMGALVTIIKLTGLVSTHNSTYFLLNIVYEAGFYFLPFFIAASCAKVFKTNTFLSMLVPAFMLYPDLMNPAKA